MKYFIFTVVTIVWPLAEEIIYRWFITENLLKVFKPWIAILISSFIFAFVHFEWNVFGNLFLLSLWLNWIYYKTRSLSYSFVAHLLVNFIAFIVLILANVKS